MHDEKSKSQKKRDAQVLRELGVRLTTLRREQLDALSLPPTLYKAITDAKALKSYGAIRRQAQFIGKLMRTEDGEAIVAALSAMDAANEATTGTFHLLEMWRTRLLTGDNAALTEFIDTYSPADIQALRQQVKKAIKEQQAGTSTTASKALFRYLRACLS